MSCENACYEAIIESCNDIVVKGALPASTAVYWLIQRQGSNNIHQRQANVNADQELTIPIAELPAGFLIKGGFYKIQIRSGADYLVPVNFVFNAIEYSCVQVQLVSINRDEDDDSEVNIIQYKAPLEIT